MKKTLLLLGIALAMLLSLNDCKKGSDDPFLSLKSRKKRVEGTWFLKSKKSRIEIKTSTGAETYIYNSDYDGQEEVTTQENDPNFNETSSYSVEFIFGKDADYSRTITISTDPDNTIYISESGNWRFLSSSANMAIKNKEQMIIIPESNIVVDTANVDGHETSGGVAETWTLTRLTNKELDATISIEEFDNITGYSYKENIVFSMESKGD